MPHQFGIHGVLEELHHVMTRIREEVSTWMPRPEESRLLRLRPGVPVLDVWRTSIDQDGEPYELTQGRTTAGSTPATPTGSASQEEG